MQIEGAVIKEQGVSFAIVVVKNHVLNDQHTAEEAAISFQPVFPGLPIILMGQDSRGVPRYFGRDDIVKFLANVDPSRIPFRRYTVS